MAFWNRNKKRLADLEAKNRELAEANREMSYRHFEAAGYGKQLSEWLTETITMDEAVARDLTKMRNNARNLEINEPYLRRWLQILEDGVIGKDGFRFGSTVNNRDGTPDADARQKIEIAWKDWAREAVTLDGRLDLIDVLRLVLRTMARDGEVLIRLHRGSEGLLLEPIEADYLPESLSDTKKNIRYGIEYDASGRPKAYHLLKEHPGSNPLAVSYSHSANTERVEARDIIHLFEVTRPGQTRGHPWCASIVATLKLLHEYQKAEVVAARTSAEVFGFIEKGADAVAGHPLGGPNAGPAQQKANAKIGAPTRIKNEPGTIHSLPEGYKFNGMKPEHPTSAFEPFMKASLKLMASGLGITYDTLASDLSDTSFSSGRLGRQHDQDYFRRLQDFMVRRFLRPVFEEWLRNALVDKTTLDLPMERIKSLKSASFRGRGFPYIQPLHDVTAQETALRLGLTSKTRICAEQGSTYEAVLAEQKRERELELEAFGKQEAEAENSRALRLALVSGRDE